MWLDSYNRVWLKKAENGLETKLVVTVLIEQACQIQDAVRAEKSILLVKILSAAADERIFNIILLF